MTEVKRTVVTHEPVTEPLINAVRLIYGVIAVLLGLRFALRLLGANPLNVIVANIYHFSGILSGPFDTIFGVTPLPTGQPATSVFEPSILVAIIIYAFIAWVIIHLLTLERPEA